MRTCTQCEQEKPLDEFPPHGGKNKQGEPYRLHRCKKCLWLYQKAIRNPEAAKQWRRDSNLQTRYGIRQVDYEAMLETQGHKCRLCGVELPTIIRNSHPVDHDHTTGIIRGVLCGNCNTGLGKFKHNPQLLARAIAYLEGT